MLLAGDELGRTQGGNNNAYCQDNELGWLDWTRDARSASADSPSSSAADRAAPRRTRSFRRRNFFQGQPLDGSDAQGHRAGSSPTAAR